MSLYASYCPVCGWLTGPTTFKVASRAGDDHTNIDKMPDHQPRTVEVSEHIRLAAIPNETKQVKAGNR